MKIYLVRHAQTEGNAQRFIQGQTDTPITELGYRQIRNTAAFFRDKEISAIYASPLGRTMTTAGQIAAEAGIEAEKIITRAELMEIDLQPWVNRQIDELMKEESISGYKVYRTEPERFVPTAGEDVRDVQNRVVRVFWEIAEAHKSQDTIVIVSHSVAIRALLLALEGRPVADVWKYPIGSASVSAVSLDGHTAAIDFVGLCPNGQE